MLSLFKLSFGNSFSSRRNGRSTLEETEEGKPDRKEEGSKGHADVPQERIWKDAKELEAKSIVKFNPARFFKDLIYHNFYPLSIPLMMWLDGGVNALINRFFVPAKGSPSGVVYSQLALGCCFYAFNGLSLFFLIREGGHLEFLYDIALVNLVWIMRNAVVATKYAFASEVDAKKMRTGVLDVSSRFHQTVLGGWSDPLPRKVLKQELLLAAVRCRSFVTNYSFQLDTNVDSFEAMRDMVLDLHLAKDNHGVKEDVDVLEEANRWLEKGRDEYLEGMSKTRSGAAVRPSCLPVRLFAAHVIRQSSSLSRLRRVGHTLLSQHLKKCAFFVSFSICILPFILRVLLGGHHLAGPKWAIWVVASSAFIILYFSIFSNIAFMMVGVLDLRRRHYVATKLDELLRTGIYTGSQHVRTVSPRSFRSRSLEWFRSINSQSTSRGSTGGTSGSERSSLTGQGIVIDFDNVQSLQAWWITRYLVHNFGLGFFKRIKYYTTYFACYCGVLIILIGLRLLKGIQREDIYILVSVVVCLDAFLTLLALMVWPGGDINTMRQVQGATLTQCKLKLQMRIHQERDELTQEELNEYCTVMQTMSSISEAVKWDNNKHKISVCGFQAGEQLLSLIVATLTASVAIGAGQIVANVVNSRNH
ncbi:hypothetical protein M758_1G172100 [Ceratodon purpureus]|nr:hypothetical protein M758_1G172100 [Ceratodon purpureus]